MSLLQDEGGGTDRPPLGSGVLAVRESASSAFSLRPAELPRSSSAGTSDELGMVLGELRQPAATRGGEGQKRRSWALGDASLTGPHLRQKLCDVRGRSEAWMGL